MFCAIVNSTLKDSCHAITRIFLHVRNAVATGGHKQFYDTDVLVVAVSVLPMLCELGMEKAFIWSGRLP